MFKRHYQDVQGGYLMPDSPILKEIKIEVTHNCNLKCTHCSSVAGENCFQQMSWEDCQKILDQASDMNVQDIAFSGGEPLLWSHLPDAVEYSKKLGFNVTVYSTGFIDNLETVLCNLNKASLDRIIFSLYAGTEDIHDDITKVDGSFISTIKAIGLALIRIGNVELHFVPMKQNFMRLPDVVNMANILGIQKVSVLRLVPQGRGSSELALDIDETVALRRIISDLRSKGHNIRLGSPYSIMCFSDSSHCEAAITKMTVSPSLFIAPCDAFKQITASSLSIKDSFENLRTCSLQDAWENSNYFNAVRNHIVSSPDDKCDACSVFNKCYSGCLAQKVHMTGKLSKMPDPLCLRQSHFYAIQENRI